eukprot:5723760-Karenia_brevis.AAC.1
MCIRDSLSISAYVVQCDATPTSIWQNAKVHALKVKSLHLPHADQITNNIGFFANIKSRTRYADPQRQNSGKAAAMHSMIRKQMKNLGCPLWASGHNVPSETTFKEEVAKLNAGLTTSVHITMRFFLTDGGGDVTTLS